MRKNEAEGDREKTVVIVHRMDEKGSWGVRPRPTGKYLAIPTLTHFHFAVSFYFKKKPYGPFLMYLTVRYIYTYIL